MVTRMNLSELPLVILIVSGQNLHQSGQEMESEQDRYYRILKLAKAKAREAGFPGLVTPNDHSYFEVRYLAPTKFDYVIGITEKDIRLGKESLVLMRLAHELGHYEQFLAQGSKDLPTPLWPFSEAGADLRAIKWAASWGVLLEYIQEQMGPGKSLQQYIAWVKRRVRQ